MFCTAIATTTRPLFIRMFMTFFIGITGSKILEVVEMLELLKEVYEWTNYKDSSWAVRTKEVIEKMNLL